MYKPICMMSKSERYMMATYNMFNIYSSDILSNDYENIIENLEGTLRVFFSTSEIKELGYLNKEHKNIEGNEDAKLTEKWALTEEGKRYYKIIKTVIDAFMNEYIYFENATENDIERACERALDEVDLIMTEEDKEWFGWYNDDEEYWEQKEKAEVGA